MASASATYDHDQRDGRRIPLAWLISLLAAAAVVSLATLGTTRAAFSSATSNGTSKFKAGTVNLTANDVASVPFDMQSMVPGNSDTKCIVVTYSGVTANVRLYGTVTNDPAGAGSLAPYLSTKIEEGTGAAGGSTFSCTGFTQTVPAPAPLLDATLQTFSAFTNFSNGLTAFGGPTGSSTRSYRITVTLQDTNAAQGKDADATFTWEAQNV
jgi:hypothetical protein